MKIFFLISLFLLITGCGTSDKNTDSEENSENTSQDQNEGFKTLSLKNGTKFLLPESLVPSGVFEVEEKNLDEFSKDLKNTGLTSNLTNYIKNSGDKKQNNFISSAKVTLGTKNEKIKFETKDKILLKIPKKAIPASILTGTAIPASAIPASAIPASAIPASAIPSSAIPESMFPSSDSLFKFLFAEAEQVEKTVFSSFIVLKDSKVHKQNCTFENLENFTDELSVKCDLSGNFTNPSIEFLVFTASEKDFPALQLSEEPLFCLKNKIDTLKNNTPPEISMKEEYEILAEKENIIQIVATDENNDYLKATVTFLPGFAKTKHQYIYLTPALSDLGSEKVIKIQVEDNGNPSSLVSKNIKILVKKSPTANKAPYDLSLGINDGANQTTQRELQVKIKALDDNGISGYCLKESSATPDKKNTCWVVTESLKSLDITKTYRTNEIFEKKTLYLWVMDLDSIISGPVSNSILLIPPFITNSWLSISGTTFTMGNNDSSTDERPEHSVSLTSFSILKNEVSAAEYEKCADAGTCDFDDTTESSKTYKVEAKKNHPVNFINWSQARAYCKWIGGDLPSEAQWEYVARGTDKRIYFWGSEQIGVETSLNCRENDCHDTSSLTAPVGSFPDDLSPLNALDMAGNVKEWVRDTYLENYYTQCTNCTDPMNSATGDSKVVRGGGFNTYSIDLTVTNRYLVDSSTKTADIGFRCIK